MVDPLSQTDVQRARLWAIGRPARRRWRRSGPRGETPYPAFSILGVAAMVSLQFEQLPVPVGVVIAVFGEEGQLGTGRRLTRRTMSRTGAASASA